MGVYSAISTSSTGPMTQPSPPTARSPNPNPLPSILQIPGYWHRSTSNPSTRINQVELRSLTGRRHLDWSTRLLRAIETRTGRSGPLQIPGSPRWSETRSAIGLACSHTSAGEQRMLTMAYGRGFTSRAPPHSSIPRRRTPTDTSALGHVAEAAEAAFVEIPTQVFFGLGREGSPVRRDIYPSPFQSPLLSAEPPLPPQPACPVRFPEQLLRDSVGHLQNAPNGGMPRPTHAPAS